MSTSRISQSFWLPAVASMIGAVPLGIGLLAVSRPRSCLSFFEFAIPAGVHDQKILENMTQLFGIRDVFLGLTIHATAYFGDRKSLAWIMLFSSAVVYVDGHVLGSYVPGAEWNHWPFGPVQIGIAAALYGFFDRA